MDKQQIIDYVMNSPANTNKMVLSDMLDGVGGGGIEIETVFEDDIMLTYEANGYSTPQGSYSGQPLLINDGYLKITLDNVIIRGTSEISGGSGKYQLFDTAGLYPIYIGVGDALGVGIMSPESSTDPNLQAYCQTPHHLKIERFTI